MNYLQHFLLAAARIIKLCFLNISLSFSSTSSVVKDREEGKKKKKNTLISKDILLFPLLLCFFASSAFLVTAFNLEKTFKFLHFSVS